MPPISGALTPVFHQYYDDEVGGPQFVADPEAAERLVLQGDPPPMVATAQTTEAPTNDSMPVKRARGLFKRR